MQQLAADLAEELREQHTETPARQCDEDVQQWSHPAAEEVAAALVAALLEEDKRSNHTQKVPLEPKVPPQDAQSATQQISSSV